MNSKILLVTLLVAVSTVCVTEGIRYGHRRYGKLFGKHYHGPHVKEPVDLKEPVNLCPQVNCPAVYIPNECRKENFTNLYGVICKGCDQNICEQNKGTPNTGNLPSRGDIPEIPKFLTQLNGGNNGRWIDTLPVNQINPISNQQWQNNIPSSDNGQWQNSIPVWQDNIPVNNQWQSNLPIEAQWNDNALSNPQWQSNHNRLPGNNIYPVNSQWNNNPPTNRQWNNLADNQWQNSFSFPNTNQWQTGLQSNNQMGPQTVMGTVVGSITSAREPNINQWESGPFQTPNFNQWQNVPTVARIPTENSLPIFKSSENIGSSITGLPFQLTGKSIDPTPVRVQIDQNIDSTKTVYDVLATVSGQDKVSQRVYAANLPNSANRVDITPKGGN